VEYPRDEVLGWDALEARVVAALPPGPCVLVV
jgi:hypothetical protein